MDIYMAHKYLLVSGPFGEISPHIAFPKVFPIDFSIMLFLIPDYSVKPLLTSL